MRLSKPIFLADGFLVGFGANAQTSPQVMEGDQRLACEALLCLAASTRPPECIPPIRKYFSISYRKFSDTLRGRLNFLNLCPTGSAPGMAAMKSAIVNGAGRCDAASVNSASWVSDQDGGGYVGNTMPDYCSALASSSYIQTMTLPRYVGEPGRGGYWVDAKDYEAANNSYQELQRKAADAASRAEANY